MRVLVSGGAGFVGSHLVDRLLLENHDVIVLDNFYTGSKDNLIEHRDNSRLEIIRHDVTSPIHIEVDGIFNLASPASPVHYQKFPVQTIRTNVMGAINMLELAHKQKIKVFQASTSEIYGDPAISPQIEEYWGNVNPIGIRACYDEGKRAAETLFFDFNRQYSVDIAVARIFNTYGPRMQFNDGRVVSNFIIQALKNENITIYGDGTQTRSFCYVSDLVDGFMRLFFAPNSSIIGPINLGNPGEYTMLDLAKLIIDLTNSNSKLEFSEIPQDDPKRRCPDISKAEKYLDWRPSVNLMNGLQLTIEDFVSRL